MVHTDTDTNQASRVMASSAVLNAASHHLFADCRQIFDAYMQCRATPDPAHAATPAARCAHLAASVLDCATQTFSSIATTFPQCQPLFRKLWRCLDNNDQNRIYCRPEERLYYKCIGKEIQIWKGRGPKDGYKGDNSRGVEEDRWPFMMHVWWYKNNHPNDEE